MRYLHIKHIIMVADETIFRELWKFNIFQLRDPEPKEAIASNHQLQTIHKISSLSIPALTKLASNS